MQKVRKIDDVQVYWNSVKPVLKELRIKIRNSQKRRSISKRTKTLEEINALVNCAKKRFVHWDKSGILVKTG